MALETVELARATAEDPAAGLPEEPCALDAPDLGLFDRADRAVAIETRIEQARAAETAARALDPRIVNSEGSQVGSEFSQLTYGNSNGFLGSYESALHSLVSEPVARQNGSLQRDHWFSVARRLSALEDDGLVQHEVVDGSARGASPPARSR